MSIRRPVALFAFSAALIAGAAETTVVFSGVLTAGGKTRVALTDTTSKVTTWVEPGDQFNGYTVTRYDPKEDAVFLKKRSQETRIALVAEKTTDVSPASRHSSPASPDTSASTDASTNAIRSNLRLLATAARQVLAEKNVASVGYADLVGPGKPIRELKPIAGENYSTLNFGPGVTAVSVTTASGATVTFDMPAAYAATTGSSASTSAASPAPITLPANADFPNAPPAQSVSPSLSATPSGSANALQPAERQPASPTYIIQGGDTWEKISESTGVPVSHLKQLNSTILEGSPLPPGQTIKVR